MRIRYLAVIAALSALVVVLTTGLIWLLLQPTPTPSSDPRPPALASASSKPSASYNPDAHDAGGEDADAPAETQEALWGPVVDNFARNFTNTRGGAAEWRKRLTGPRTQPYVTAAVAEQLRTVDVRNVPTGHYEDRELVKTGPYEIGVKVTYREGWAQVLYLITDGTRWQVYAYDIWED